MEVRSSSPGHAKFHGARYRRRREVVFGQIDWRLDPSRLPRSHASCTLRPSTPAMSSRLCRSLVERVVSARFRTSSSSMLPADSPTPCRIRDTSSLSCERLEVDPQQARRCVSGISTGPSPQLATRALSMIDDSRQNPLPWLEKQRFANNARHSTPTANSSNSPTSIVRHPVSVKNRLSMPVVNGLRFEVKMAHGAPPKTILQTHRELPDVLCGGRR